MNKSFILLTATAIILGQGTLSVSAQENKWLDVTSDYITNPTFDVNGSGWTISSWATNNYNYGAVEFYNGIWDMRQVIDLPNGHYRVSVNAFHRYGSNSSNQVQAYMEGTEKIPSYLLANDQTVTLKSVYSENLTENYNWGCYSPSRYNTLWFPNNMESAEYCFTKGMYSNQLEVDVTDGTLTIGIVNTEWNNSNWCIMDNWKLEVKDGTQQKIASSDVALSQLIINEIQVDNVDQNVDPSWNYGAWMELYNPTDSIINIQGCYVSDDTSDPMKAKLEKRKYVPAHGYACVWFDHYDRYCRSQINFKPSVEGGILMISTPSGKVIGSEEYPAGTPRTSYARTADGTGEWGITSSPTPEATNATSKFAEKRLDAPVPNIDSQLFSGSLSFNVSIPSGATLRYTTDGSTPSLTNGQVSSTRNFTCSATTTYRFCVTQDDRLTSPVVTRTFVLNNITHSLPVISVVSDNKNLYSDELGVFVKGVNGRTGNGQETPCNWNMDWERPVNFEYIDTDGTVGINQEVGLERCGGWSRGWNPFSFKLKANKVYEGNSSLPYRFFESKPYLKHKTLQIRNGGNDNTCRIKDPALQAIIARSGLYIDWQGYQPVQHYINGKYAGVINMREPNNKHYVYANYGLDDDEIDQFEMSPDSGYVQKVGNRDAFLRWYEYAKVCGTSQAAYDSICKMVDIDEYCNYMAVEFYLGGTDWPQNNVKGYRQLTDDGKFRFILFDTDFAFYTEDPFNLFEGKQDYTFDYLRGIDENGNDFTGTHIQAEIEFVTIFLNMLQNDAFRKRFIDTYCVIGGSIFEPTRCQEIIDELTARVADVQSLSSEVYGNGSSPAGTASDIKRNLSASRQSKMIDVLKNYSRMNLSAVTPQTVSLSADADGAQFLVNGIPVPTGKFSGQLFSPVSLKACAPAGYRFVSWKNGSTVVSDDAEYNLPSSGAFALTACFEKLDKDACAKAGMPTAPIVINEVSAANSINVNEYGKKDDWIELYNTTDADIDLEGAYLTDNPDKPTKYQISASGTKASTVIPAHGYKIVWCSKRDTDTELHASFKLDNADGIVRIQAADGSWSDQMNYCAMNGDETCSRWPDGSADIYLSAKTSILHANTLTAYDVLQEKKDDASGIKNITADGSLHLACNAGTVTVTSVDAQSVEIYVYSLDGKTLLSKSVSLVSGKASMSLDGISQPVIVKAVDSEGNVCQLKVKA